MGKINYISLLIICYIFKGKILFFIRNGGVLNDKEIPRYTYWPAFAKRKSSHERYNVPFGLAIMASDAVSSVSYAAEEILGVLITVIGLASYKWLGWVSLMIIILLLILTISYIQIIHAYPHGGGAYMVAKENINLKSGLVAASALLVDYILTVAVSSSAELLQ